jgi:hypothetical protein
MTKVLEDCEAARTAKGCMMKITILAIAGLTTLAGCETVTVTEPVSVGPDTYMIGLGDSLGLGLKSDAQLLAQSIKAAGAFCAAQHRVIVVQSTNASGIQGWTPQSNQVFFKCILPSPS